MLQKISIKNYALIRDLSIDFSTGLSIITGETGAGKSILLGALGLVLGNRADSTALLDNQQKCVVEAEINLKGYQLKSFFDKNDLDYEVLTILRREILPSGKSRAFVNDTPVTLQLLNELRVRLIDIHSQHQTLQISDKQFQCDFIDTFAGIQSKLDVYRKNYRTWQGLKQELALLIQQQREALQQSDYNQHLYDELESAQLIKGEQEELEVKLEKLNHVEDIKSNLSQAKQLVQEERMGLQTQLYTLELALREIAEFSTEYQALHERITSLKIELDDIVVELENEDESLDYNPHEIDLLNDRLQLIYNLQKKHYVNTIEALLSIQEELSAKLTQVESGNDLIAEKESQLTALQTQLTNLSSEISSLRVQSLSSLTQKMESIISELGMPQATFNVELSNLDHFTVNGTDQLRILFSANKGMGFGDLKKVASGGELSRIMLAIKKILSENSQLPTIIFDEIDTGVSGEIANKMAEIMKSMSKRMQVITITHLPQIAAKGIQHYKVFKTENEKETNTQLTLLDNEERIVEIAQMLSGKHISDSAISHAKELLN